MTEIVKLSGSLRNKLGSAESRRLRKNDRLPAVIYGDESENVFLDVNTKEFEKEYFKGGVETKVFEIEAEGREFRVLCYQIDINPVSDRPRHVDFLSLAGKKEVRVLVPLKFKNIERSAGLKKGGYFNVMVRKLPLVCPVDQIPNSIEVSCEDMRLKQSVKISNLVLPEGSRPVSKKDLMLARIIGRGKDEEEQAQTAGTATTATPEAAAGGAATTTTATPAKGGAAGGKAVAAPAGKAATGGAGKGDKKK
ncbi:50S ribosomal protein L25 [Bacilli bacterium]|nr:50S ribosomal protein L25 [Bacilli bacterium]